jgi:uncharacterized membrane protein (UPF0127 family)
LERRARSFLRFAFAMTGSVPAGRRYREVVAVSTGGWRFEPVLVAESFVARRRGLRPRSAGRGMLIRARSVHGFGMDEPLGIVFIAREGLVVGSGTLLPGRILRCPSRWTLELPPTASRPAVGAMLWVLPSTMAWPAP